MVNRANSAPEPGRGCETIQLSYVMQILRSSLRYFSSGLFFLAASTAPVIFYETGIDSGDPAWILSATALSLLMTLSGLALSCAGLVQPKTSFWS